MENKYDLPQNRTKNLLVLTIGTALILLASFTLLKGQSSPYKESNQVVLNADQCKTNIKYYIAKVKNPDGQEIPIDMEVIVYPSKKIINVAAKMPERDPVTFNTVLESTECSLTQKMDGGQALYKGYITQADGTKTFAAILIKVNSGKCTISALDEEGNEKGFAMAVDKWEVLKDE
ncbi:hypothetical protein [Pedobacter metabolipauper]|uniref:Uncharacterized protein n=1 Tax=Pedobacter metabolipauper TaxID=425513 RepID=A0A4R6SWU9_9SPHI|nr:hypothetical protein [Pedobacter metabolipauper]TDQ09876.1 hypothetical protein ATK78_2035 [Pedobacter metabolipauper]